MDIPYSCVIADVMLCVFYLPNSVLLHIAITVQVIVFIVPFIACKAKKAHSKSYSKR